MHKKQENSTNSLTNRINVAFGIHSVGIKEYYTRLLQKLGIKVTKEIEYYFQKQEEARSCPIETLKRKAIKRNVM